MPLTYRQVLKTHYLQTLTREMGEGGEGGEQNEKILVSLGSEGTFSQHCLVRNSWVSSFCHITQSW